MSYRNLSANMAELQWHVVTRCYCPWELFLENVKNEGVSFDALCREADACGDDWKKLHGIVNRFI